VWLFSLRLFLCFVTAPRAFAHPSCQMASRCICVPLLPTRFALPVLFMRLGAHIANSPFLSLGHPTLAMPYKKIYLQAKIGSYPSSGSPFCLVLPCVVVFVTTLRVFGCPSCLLALRCVWLPLLPISLTCPWSPNLGHAVLKNLPPSQNWYLSVLRLVFFPSAPLCGHFCYGSSCVWGPILPS
jgi:hypothetical protein